MMGNGKMPPEITEIVLTIADAGQLTATAVYFDGQVGGYQLTLDGADLGSMRLENAIWIAYTPSGDQACSYLNPFNLFIEYATEWAKSAQAGEWPGNGQRLDLSAYTLGTIAGEFPRRSR